jgi:cytochrome c553
MNKRTFTYLNNILWAAILLILSGCYTVLLHQPSRVAENASEPVDSDSSSYQAVSFEDRCVTCHGNDFHAYEYADRVQPYGLMNSRWTAYYEGAEPWWQNMPGYESLGDQTLSGASGNMRRHYGRRREALNNDNNNNNSSLTVGYMLNTSSIPLTVPTFVATSTSVDSNKSQNTNTTGSNTQTSKTKPQNTQREYGARENAKKR